jgi:hypothetical protein
MWLPQGVIGVPKNHNNQVEPPPGAQPVNVTHHSQGFTAQIPLAELGGDRNFRLELLVAEYTGGHYYASDCAPNGGSVLSPDGKFVPPQDDDDDGRLDWIDVCLNEPPGWVPDSPDTYAWPGIVEITDVRQRDITVPLEAAHVRGAVTIENSKDWTCWTTVSVRVDWYPSPSSCELKAIDGTWKFGGQVLEKRVKLGPNEKKRLTWSTTVSCDRSTPAGYYPVGVSVSAYDVLIEVRQQIADGGTTATLRIR